MKTTYNFKENVITTEEPIVWENMVSVRETSFKNFLKIFANSDTDEGNLAYELVLEFCMREGISLA